MVARLSEAKLKLRRTGNARRADSDRSRWVDIELKLTSLPRDEFRLGETSYDVLRFTLLNYG